MTAAQAGAAVAADRVDFVNEDDAGRFLLALLEQVRDWCRADSDEHLDEVGARNGKERDVSLSRNRSRQESLPCSGRAHEQHALRDSPAELLELLRANPE